MHVKRWQWAGPGLGVAPDEPELRARPVDPLRGAGGVHGYQVCRPDGSGFDPCICSPSQLGDDASSEAEAAASGFIDAESDAPDATAESGSARDGAADTAEVSVSDASNESGDAAAQPVSRECFTAQDCDALLGPLAPMGISCPEGGLGFARYICVGGICQATFCR
jgi:hypothetical protein